MRLFGFLVSLVASLSTCACDSPRGEAHAVPPPSPDEVVSYLVSAPHGPARSTERGRQLFAELRAHPGRYVEPIRRRLELPNDGLAHRVTAHCEAQRTGAALGLAGSLAKEFGGPLVREFFDATQLRITQLRKSPEGDDPREQI